MQDVNHQLFTESVSQEMSLSMKRFNLEKLNQYLDIVNLNNYKIDTQCHYRVKNRD